MRKNSNDIILRSLAWVPEKYVCDETLKAYIYAATDKQWNDEEHYFEEVEIHHVLPKFNKRRTHIGFPRGNLGKLRYLLEKEDINYIDKRSISPLGIDLELCKHVTDDPRWERYQEKIVNSWLDVGIGGIKAPAASGKSIIAIGIICRLKLRTLCIFNRKDFRRQWLEELNRHTNILDLEKATGEKIAGIYHGNAVFYPITFSTFQQLNVKSAKEAAKKFKNYFGLLVIDEAHHAAAPSFREIISTFNPETYLWVTATPLRGDSLEEIYYDYIGPIATIGGEEQMTPLVYIINTNIEIPRPSSHPPWALWGRIINKIYVNNQRNELICAKINENYLDGRCILVISDRVAHCNELARILVSKFNVPKEQIVIVTGSVTDRDDKYNDIRSGKCNILIATKVLDEGVNVTRLDTLHLATPLASKEITEQRVGRIRRPLPNKKDPIVYDWLDIGHGIIYGAAMARQKVYNRIGAIIFVDGKRINEMGTGYYTPTSNKPVF